MGLLDIDVYIIRIFEYIRISYANIRIAISAFVDIPNIKQTAGISPRTDVAKLWSKHRSFPRLSPALPQGVCVWGGGGGGGGAWLQMTSALAKLYVHVCPNTPLI